MTERQLKYIATWLYLGLQAGIVAYTLIFAMMPWISWDLAKNVLARVFPVFVGYTTAMLSFVESDRNVVVDESKLVTKTFSILACAVPIIYSIVVAVLIYLQGFHVGSIFSSSESFLDALTLSQAFFAAYIGKLMSGLFPSANVTSNKSPASRASRKMDKPKAE